MPYVLAGMAFCALLVERALSVLDGGGVPAVCGVVGYACLLITTALLHRRSIRPVPHAEDTSPAASFVAESATITKTAAPQDDEIAAPQETLPTETEGEPSSPATALDSLPPSPALEPAPSVSTLNFSTLSDALLTATDPIAELKRFVGDIRTREAEHDGVRPTPCELERYAARMLEEAGLFSSEVELPPLVMVRPPLSHMVYLRTAETSIPYLAKLRIIRLEAALNAIRFATASLAASASMQEAYLLNQGLARSIVAQAAPLDEPLDPTEAGDWPEGEWTVRYGISRAIESLQLPYRLQVRYRVNVADGNVALEFDLTPAEVFPASCHVDGLGIVPSTGDMRQRAAADYALRVALLLAASAFRCSEGIRHVWVAGILETATRRTCYLSVDFDRWRFARIDLTNVGDLAETYRSFAPVLRYEDGWLRPVRQGFHLEEERFCPVRRYLPVSLSSRRLKGHVAQSLGTDHVSGLAIEEGDGRTLVANAIMMRLAPESDVRATEKNVRTVMQLAGDDPDPSVRTAAERVVLGLIEGTLEPSPFSIGEEFIRGDALTRANDRAKELLMGKRPDEAHAKVAPVLACIDQGEIYRDTAHVAYRYFNSYVERALYNRLQEEAGDSRTIMLVPDAYYEAHLLVSMTALMTGSKDEALAHAQRMVELAPLDPRARLHTAKCLEVLERDEEAIEQLRELLERAHDPQSLGVAYYRMAFFQWKQGNLAAAQACYQYAMRFLPQAVPMLAMELSVMYLQNPDALSQEESSDEQLAEALEAQGIPLAPTEQTTELFYDCARASFDAEIFPVARTFAQIMRAFGSDDVITGVIRSLEDEPDR